MNGERAAQAVAARLVRMAIRRAAVEEFGRRESFEDGEGGENLGPALDVADVPLAGVRAALVAHRVAFGQMRDFAERARGAGRSWADVADALGLATGDEEPRLPGEVAFEWLIEGRDPDGERDRSWARRPTAWWTCSACGGRVTDRGPFEPHPDDNETGHTPDCARHRAAVDAYRRELDEEDF